MLSTPPSQIQWQNERGIQATYTGKMNEQSNNFALLNINLSSDTVRLKTGTRSLHRLGYANLHKRIISASIPVAIVPLMQM